MASQLDRPTNCSWRRPPESLILEKFKVHLWLAQLDLVEPDFNRLEILLDARERERSHRFHYQPHRKWFIARRAILRLLLGQYTGLNPAQLRYDLGPAGKPHLAAHKMDQTITFSISHSQGVALFGFARCRRIGVDLESMRPLTDMEQLVTHVFSSREKDAYFALPTGRRQEAFFRCWTAKEAFLKALGDGLSLGLDHFDILPEPDTRMRLQSVRGDPEAPERWLLDNITPLDGFAAAVAVEKSRFPEPIGRDPIGTIESFIYPVGTLNRVLTESRGTSAQYALNRLLQNPGQASK